MSELRAIEKVTKMPIAVIGGTPWTTGPSGKPGRGDPKPFNKGRQRRFKSGGRSMARAA
jgi:hypothetical protein